MSEWLSPAEAGAILGVGPDRVAQLAREGVLTPMRTPGGHLRVRRDEVEQLVAETEVVPRQSRRQRPTEPETPTGASVEPAAPARPRWEEVPPWKRRVREAEADVEVLRLGDERARLMEARAQRQAEREQADAEEATRAAEAQRLRDQRAFAFSCMPHGVPEDVGACVARDIERLVTSDRYPASLARGHVEALLRAEVERLLRPWRARQARRQRLQQEAAEREHVIGWAVLHRTLRLPRDWDSDTRKAFERELREALEDEYEPGMTQEEADEIALDVLDDWIEDDGEENE